MCRTLHKNAGVTAFDAPVFLTNDNTSTGYNTPQAYLVHKVFDHKLLQLPWIDCLSKEYAWAFLKENSCVKRMLPITPLSGLPANLSFHG